MNNPPIILAIDDEEDILTTFKVIFKDNYEIIGASKRREAISIIKKQNIDLVLLDIKMPKTSGIEILKEIKRIDPTMPVIMITALKEISLAVECMKLSAYDYVAKPFDNAELKILIGKAIQAGYLARENLRLRELIKENSQFENIVGKSKEALKLFELIARVAKSDSTVLITGESGTGKELAAKAIHRRGKRDDKPFVAVNCASIPENLLESELFGHEKGSFTGAFDKHIGKFEIADGGTLFLDEIGCMPHAMQSKLLRVLQENHIERIGSAKSISIDVRVIAATNIDIKNAITNNKFRADLFYRLNVIPIHLPPLRERKDDIPLLIEHFSQKLDISKEAMDALIEYKWPGNIRELENLIERLIILKTDNTINIGDLPIEIISGSHKIPAKRGHLKEACREFEKRYIEHVLKETGNNQTKTSKILGLHRTTLMSKLQNLGVSPD